MKKLFVLLNYFIFNFINTNGAFAQLEVQPKHMFNINISLPNTFTNKAYQNIMQGLVNVQPYYSYVFKNNMLVGAGVSYTYFTANEYKVSESISGGMHMGTLFAKVGWQKFHNDRFATDLSLKAGYSASYFKTNLNDSLYGGKAQQVNAVLIEPEFSIILTADERTSYRFFIGYAFQGYHFRPSLLGLSSSEGYKDSDLNKISTFLEFGLGFTYYLGKVK